MTPEEFKNAAIRNIADGIRKAKGSGVLSGLL